MKNTFYLVSELRLNAAQVDGGGVGRLGSGPKFRKKKDCYIYVVLKDPGHG